MKSYTTYYLITFLVFIFLAAVCFSYKLVSITLTCPDPPSLKFKSNMITCLNKALPSMYLLCGFIAFYISMLSLFFNYMYITPQLGQLPKFFSILGATQKLVWHLLRFFHYILLIVLTTFTFKLMTAPKCIKDERHYFGLLSTAAVLDLIWLIMHLGGPVIRSLFEPEIAIYMPEDPNSSVIVSLLLFRCGP